MTGYEFILYGIPWTLALTALSFTFGAILGLPLCAASMSESRMIREIAYAIILLLRSIPPVVWLFLIFFGVGSGSVQLSPIQAALIGLSLIAMANMSEIYRGAYRGIHRGQFEAAAALGLSSGHQFVDVVAPQLIRIALPSAATFAIGLLKDSSVASLIGVQDIAFGMNALAQRTFSGVGIFALAAVIYILLSIPIAFLSRWLDLRLRAGVGR